MSLQSSLREVPTLAALLALFGAGCASTPAAKPDAPKSNEPPPSASVPAEPVAAAPAGPLICEVASTEGEVANEILARSGRGLLWLVTPADEKDELRAVMKRGADEVRSARTLAECLLRHWDPGFDAIQSKSLADQETWLDAHVGPEHAPTLLAAGAAYSASLLVAKSWIDAAFDVPLARTFLERANKAAPELAEGLGPLILGAFECYVPKPVGGQPDSGKARLETAAARPGQLRLAMKVAEAELCSFALQDHALFNRLLDEVDATKAGASTFDLLAKARAKTLRTEAEDMFPDDY